MFHSIVVGTDGSATADSAVARAAELAKLTGAVLTIVSAYRPKSGATVSTGEQFETPGTLAEVDATLTGAQRLAAANGIDATTRSGRGEPADVIVDIATEIGADLIVVGNKGMQRRILGSVPNTVAHRAPCDVLIIHTT